MLELFNARKQLSNQVHIQKRALEEQASQLRARAQKLQQLNSSIIDTLATVIEFRNCESGEHVKRIRSLTMDILEKVCDTFPEYGVLREEIPLIGEVAGSGLSQYCYDICRHHHERWSGKGYPDGLKGDEIPIWAQVVSIADVYDALVSSRVYKKACSREKAISMICGGECGEFNPKLLECFLQAEASIYEKWYKDQKQDQLFMTPLQWKIPEEENNRQMKRRWNGKFSV